jgi:HK97 family phage major capsid protein
MFIPFTNVAGTENVGGAAVYMPPGGIAGQPYGTLFGRPVLEIEQASALGDLGDIVLLDPSRYRTISKGGAKEDVSIHVRFLTDETAFRFVVRVNGQPMEKKPVTPFKGSTAKSSFVTLAAR